MYGSVRKTHRTGLRCARRPSSGRRESSVRSRRLLFVAVLIFCATCKRENGKIGRSFPFLERLHTAPTTKTDLIQMQADDGQWIMPAKNYASTRFSTLNQITAQNVSTMKVAWTFSTGHDRGHEAAPLVVNNTMYIVTPFPNELFALDLTQPGAPAKWKFRPPEPKLAAKGVACCDWV